MGFKREKGGGEGRSIVDGIVRISYNRPKEGREGQRAIAGKGPHLARGRDEDGQPHQVLHDEEKGDEAHGAVLAEGVVVDLGHLPFFIARLGQKEHRRHIEKLLAWGNAVLLARSLLLLTIIRRKKRKKLTGCPNELPSTASTSWSMQAASTITITNPRPQHMPMEDRMPRGTAFAALDASSDMCTHESKAPMVQMGDSQASMNAQPVGQVVRFATLAKMNSPSLRWLALPTGSATMVARIRAIFCWELLGATDALLPGGQLREEGHEP